MAEVLVVFDKGGTPGTPAGARINQDLIRGSHGRRITWDFLSCDSNIQSALVYFEDDDARFFPVRGGQPRKWYVKDLQNHKEYITGVVPRYGKSGPPVAAKYWVMGFDRPASTIEAEIASGKDAEDLKDDALSLLDPVVVTGEPH